MVMFHALKLYKFQERAISVMMILVLKAYTGKLYTYETKLNFILGKDMQPCDN